MGHTCTKVVLGRSLDRQCYYVIQGYSDARLWGIHVLCQSRDDPWTDSVTSPYGDTLTCTTVVLGGSLSVTPWHWDTLTSLSGLEIVQGQSIDSVGILCCAGMTRVTWDTRVDTRHNMAPLDIAPLSIPEVRVTSTRA